NPGFEDLAGALIGADGPGAYSLRMPTAAAAHLVLAVDVWRETQPGCGQLQWLVTPKLLKAAVG
ncbi:MAG: histidine phosphatase family protein, partial [Anaerolineae bacterium]|nr:histidine phosphatase family protein [Anaerolineae bacterium]